MANTLNYGFPKPETTANVDAEFYRLQTTIDMIDAVVKTLADVVAGKSASGHGHGISEIAGLVAALAGKMNADQTFSLDDLGDVDGAAAAAVNYVLVKNSTGLWVPSSAIAALGVHEHSIGHVAGLATELASKVSKVGGKFESGLIVDDVQFTDPADNTRRGRIDVGAVTAGQSRVYTLPDRDLNVNPAEEWVFDGHITNLTFRAWLDMNPWYYLHIGYELWPLTTPSAFGMQVSSDNGATWVAGANYTKQSVVGNNTTVGAAAPAMPSWQMTATNLATAGVNGFGVSGVMELYGFNQPRTARITAHVGYQVSTSGTTVAALEKGIIAGAIGRNAFRIVADQAFSGWVKIKGIRG